MGRHIPSQAAVGDTQEQKSYVLARKAPHASVPVQTPPHVGKVASPHAVVPSGTHAHGPSGTRESVPQCCAVGHCPLQNGKPASTQACVPSGMQPQKVCCGSSSRTQRRIGGHVPPQAVVAAMSHGGRVVVVVVVAAQPPVVQASQQLDTLPTHAPPPAGGVQCAASFRTLHLVTGWPFRVFVRQQVTNPGLPQVDFAAQLTTTLRQSLFWRTAPACWPAQPT